MSLFDAVIMFKLCKFFKKYLEGTSIPTSELGRYDSGRVPLRDIRVCLTIAKVAVTRLICLCFVSSLQHDALTCMLRRLAHCDKPAHWSHTVTFTLFCETNHVVRRPPIRSASQRPAPDGPGEC